MQHTTVRKALLAGVAGLCAAMALTLSGCTMEKDETSSGSSSMGSGSSNTSRDDTGSHGNLPEDNASNGVISDGGASGDLGDTMRTDAAGRSRAGDDLGTNRTGGMDGLDDMPNMGVR